MTVQMYGLIIQIAQVIAVGLSAFVSGLIAAFSVFIIPALLLPTCPPALATKQWRTVYELGKQLCPLLAFISSIAYTYLAYSSTGLKAYAYAVAAATTIFIGPFTLTVMVGTNNKLTAHAKEKPEAKTMSEEEIRGLLSKWAGLNGVRAAFPAVGAAIGFAALLGWFA